MKIIALDFMSKRIGTLDYGSDSGGGTRDIPTYGRAAGVATVTSFIPTPAVGYAAGQATAVGLRYDPNALLEPLWIYPWSDGGSGRPVHARGDTVYSWQSYPTAPASGTDFVAMATLQANTFGAASNPFRSSAGPLSKNWPGAGYYSIATGGPDVFGTMVALGGDAVAFDNTGNSSPVNASVNTTDAQCTYQRTGAYTPQLIYEGTSFPASMLVIPTGTHVYLAKYWSTAPGTQYDAEMLAWREEYDGGRSPPGGYAPIPFSQDIVGPVGARKLSTTWISYLLRLRAERVPHHPTTKDGKTWVIDVAGPAEEAKQLAGIEYRGGYLYQNALGPVIRQGDPRYNDAAFWEAQRTIAINNGTMKGDVTYPVLVNSWARAL